MALQPDAKILVGGTFQSINGEPRGHIARLFDDGTLDPSFQAMASDWVRILVLEEDGKILVAGNFKVLNHEARASLGRLNADGSLDDGFDPSPDASVYAIALQADGKILVGGALTRLAGQPCAHLGRLNSDGTFDTSFNPPTNGWVGSLVLQPDGKIIVSGNQLLRLNPDGSLDSTFTPSSGVSTTALALQADGKILFGNLRLNPDGTLDTNYNTGVSGFIHALALQTDGKVIMAGKFGGLATNVGRFNSDGTMDTSFNVSTDVHVETLLLQEDGKILLGGWFRSVNGVSRLGIARLNNTEPATESLTLQDTNLTWLRGGTSPEVWRASFEVTTNGTNWTNLGSGSHIAGGWQLQGVSVPPNGSIRARGFGNVQGGLWNGSAWFVQSGIGAPFIFAQPLGFSVEPGQVAHLSVGADGSAPISYQWQFNGQNILGAIDAILSITNIQESSAGSYSVVVTGPSGSVTSSVAPLSVVNGFHPISMNAAFAALPMPAGQILLSGRFWTWEGNQFYGLGRLHNDGTLDTSFKLYTNLAPSPLGLQPDGKVLLSGADLRTKGKFEFGRLNTDGTVDVSFAPNIEGYVSAVVIQADEKILVAGDFSSIAGQPCTNFARLNRDGSFDLSFKYGAVGRVESLALLEDGRMVVAGQFTELGGQPCVNIARLDSNGVLDPLFAPKIEGWYRAVLAQADGKLLVAGSFTNVPGAERTYFGRLNSDGTWDANFHPPELSPISMSLALQANGKILLSNYRLCPKIVRLNSDGSRDLDFGFEPGRHEPDFMALESDGDVLAVMGFGSSILRITNNEAATQELTFDGSTITWRRGGSSPEANWVHFEGSTNGTDWVDLGTAHRISGAWQLSGVNFPQTGQIRARGGVSVIAGSWEPQFWYHVETSIGAPFIFAEPENQVAPAASRAAITVGVGGSEPLQYQWLFNNVPLAGQTNALLSLRDLQETAEGSYAVIVSNLYGAATSRIATLTITNPPPLPVIELRETVLTNNVISFTWDTLIGAQYHVQYTTNVEQGAWITLTEEIGTLSPSYGYDGITGLITAMGTSLTVTPPYDTNQHRFYRVIALPR